MIPPGVYSCSWSCGVTRFGFYAGSLKKLKSFTGCCAEVFDAVIFLVCVFYEAWERVLGHCFFPPGVIGGHRAGDWL